MKLSAPDFFELLGLRREDTYYDHGNPVPGWLIPNILNGLLTEGLLELGDPECYRAPVTSSSAGCRER